MGGVSEGRAGAAPKAGWGWRAALAAGVLALTLASPALAAMEWAWLGVRIRDLSEQEMDEISRRHGLTEGFGAMILEVIKEAPAESGGIRAGDIVVGFQDRPIVDTRSLQRHVARAAVGEPVALTVLRAGEGRRRLSVTPAVMPRDVAAERIAAEMGFLVREPEAPGLVLEARGPGVPAVAAVLRGSRAERAGLKTGDLLVEVNGRLVSTVDAVREALLAVGPEAPVLLVVRRERESLSLRLEAGPTP
jgi:serine protease Do